MRFQLFDVTIFLYLLFEVHSQLMDGLSWQCHLEIPMSSAIEVWLWSSWPSGNCQFTVQAPRVSLCILVSWSTPGSGEEKAQPTWSLSSLAHVVRESRQIAVETSVLLPLVDTQIYSVPPGTLIHLRFSNACLCLPHRVGKVLDSGWKGIISPGTCFSLLHSTRMQKYQWSIFHYTEMGIFLGDKRTV